MKGLELMGNSESRNFVQSPYLLGAKDLFDKLVTLEGLDSGNIIKAAVRAGLNVAKKAAIEKIPKGTEPFRTYTGRLVAPGFASRNLKLIVVLSKDKTVAQALLGVTKEAYYAVQFVERGTSKMAAQPWLRPAFYATGNAQQAAMVAYLQKRVNKIAQTGTV